MSIVLYKLKIIIGWLLISLLLLHWSKHNVDANSLLFADDFNDNDFSDWTVQRNQQWYHPEKKCLNTNKLNTINSDEFANWEIINGQLGIIISGGPSCTTEITPNSLNLTPEKEFEISFDWNFLESTNMDRNFLVIWQDANNWYGLKALDSKLRMQKVVDGIGWAEFDTTGVFNFIANQTYHFIVTVKDNLIKVTVDNQLVISMLDFFPLIKGFKTIGLQASTGSITRSVSFFDNLIVTSLAIPGEQKLGVTLLKQHNPAWGHFEYDHAKQWAQKFDIQRWGCALTSMAMILNYHGIAKMPNGRLVTPPKLNAWLTEQPDGYLGEGLLNWLAVTRLTKLISQQQSTPVLEYSQISGSNLEPAIEQIKQNLPVILQIPGHFLVADGFTVDQTDLYLKDPAYQIDKFSQHDQQLLSTKIFTPSQTDLSYILIAHSNAITVKLNDANQQPISNFQQSIENVHNPLGESEPALKQQTTPLVIETLAKPANGFYQLIINNPQLETEKVIIFAYDTQGGITDLSQEIKPNQIKKFTLNFNQTATSTLQEKNNIFITLRALLTDLYQQHAILVKYVYLVLDELAQYAENDTTNQDRYINLIATEIEKFNQFITTDGKNQILKLLSEYPQPSTI